MRKTDINRYSNTVQGFKHPQIAQTHSKITRILKSLSALVLRFLSSIAVIFAITGILILISLNVYKSVLIEDDVALNITASKLALTSFVYVNDSQGNPQEYQRVYSSENRVWIDFKDIPMDMKNAIIAIEDKRFYDHGGVDWIRTAGAVMNLVKGTQSYGGSTLTQQLIKNITEDNQVSLTRKLREIFRAVELERKYSKDEILESYLNVVNFGGGSRGVQAAANLYFNKNIQDCSLAQCATIASITQNPTAYNPIYHPENNKIRRELVLSEMLEQGKITSQKCNEALEESQNMKFTEPSDDSQSNANSGNVRNWYMETLIRDVAADLCAKYAIGKSAAEDMILKQGLKIYCAMDTRAQEIAEDSLQDSQIMPKDSNLELGYTMMGLDGRILATIGSRKEKKGNLLYDRANVAKRQPGSIIKPIAAYAPIIDLGIYNYSSLIPDEPLQIDSDGNNVIKNWPENWYKSYKGHVTLQWAIEKSANAPAAQMVKLLTPLKSYEFLSKKLEMRSLDSHDAVSLSALATGGTHRGVTVREMTAAFQIFGNGGKFHKPYTYFYVTDRDDKVILDNRDKIPTEAIKPETATIMNRLLRNVIVGPEGTGRSANIANWNIVGKTGTTTDDHDSWFIGVSPYAVAGIWTGYDNPKRIYETAAAIRIWKHIMTKYLENKPNIDFNYDSSVVQATYCKNSGLLATSNCSSAAIGYYSPENMPKYCSSHYGYPAPETQPEENSDDSEALTEHGESSSGGDPDAPESSTPTVHSGSNTNLEKKPQNSGFSQRGNFSALLGN